MHRATATLPGDFAPVPLEYEALLSNIVDRLLVKWAGMVDATR